MTTSTGYASVSLATSLLNGWASRYTAKLDQAVIQGQYAASQQIAAANNELFNQQAEIENALRAGQNRILAAQAAADAALRAISNQRILARAEDDYTQAAENFLRTQESLVQGDLEDQVAAAEQRGAYAASSALSGTLGTTIEGMEYSLRLKQNRAGEYAERQGNYLTHDQLQQMAGIVPAAISQLDTTTSIPALDYGYTFSQAKTLGPETLAQPAIAGSFFTDGWSWALRNEDGFNQVGASISSWFTPKSTVADYIGSEWN